MQYPVVKGTFLISFALGGVLASCQKTLPTPVETQVSSPDPNKDLARSTEKPESTVTVVDGDCPGLENPEPSGGPAIDRTGWEDEYLSKIVDRGANSVRGFVFLSGRIIRARVDESP